MKKAGNSVSRPEQAGYTVEDATGCTMKTSATNQAAGLPSLNGLPLRSPYAASAVSPARTALKAWKGSGVLAVYCVLQTEGQSRYRAVVRHCWEVALSENFREVFDGVGTVFLQDKSFVVVNEPVPDRRQVQECDYDEKHCGQLESEFTGGVV